MPSQGIRISFLHAVYHRSARRACGYRALWCRFGAADRTRRRNRIDCSAVATIAPRSGPVPGPTTGPRETGTRARAVAVDRHVPKFRDRGRPCIPPVFGRAEMPVPDKKKSVREDDGIDREEPYRSPASARGGIKPVYRTSQSGSIARQHIETWQDVAEATRSALLQESGSLRSRPRPPSRVNAAAAARIGWPIPCRTDCRRQIGSTCRSEDL